MTFLTVFRGQELCGETPRVPCEELGARERQTDPNEDREGERERCRGGGEGLTTSILWWSQWGRQPHQVRSMKQVCVLVFVSVGVCVCIRVCGWILCIFIFTVHLCGFPFLSCVCVFSFLCACTVCMYVFVCVYVLCLPPIVLIFSSLHIIRSSTNLSGFPTTEFQPSEIFPHFYHPLLVSKTPAGINFPH